MSARSRTNVRTALRTTDWFGGIPELPVHALRHVESETETPGRRLAADARQFFIRRPAVCVGAGGGRGKRRP
jgi:hypothetical protein